ncbi:hypothetical protein LPJ72_005759 [Coemansia sp. Benny D160-2]|nr:hypothetical protein LPJ72_005759 [Coemansia sp. Benny D160-2]
MQISGKVAVITGAARGFGKRLAEVIVDKGGFVVVADVLEEEGIETARELNGRAGAGGRKTVAVFHRCDVRDLNSIGGLVSAAEKDFGRVDIMVNNAGVGGTVPWTDADNGSVSRTIDINMKAPIEGTRVAVKYFIDRGHPGCVVNVASMMAFFPAEFGPVYGATKSGVVNFTAACATLAQADPPIRVNAVAPNFADTAMVRDSALGASTSVLGAGGILTVDEVVDQMVRCIEDESLSGDTIKLLPGKSPLVHKGRKAVSLGVITGTPKL